MNVLIDLQEADPAALATLLRDCVALNASIGWTSTPSADEAAAFWKRCQQACARGERRGWVLLDPQGQALGSAQLVLDMPANGAHRAEVCKVMVSPNARRQGLGERLMTLAESEARLLGRTLLVLDTLVGSPAERLYRRLGFQVCGAIPDYAMSTEGRLEATQILYKVLS